MAHLHLQGFTLAGPLAKGSALPSTQLPLQVPLRLLFQAGFCDLSGSPMTWPLSFLSLAHSTCLGRSVGQQNGQSQQAVKEGYLPIGKIPLLPHRTPAWTGQHQSQLQPWREAGDCHRGRMRSQVLSPFPTPGGQRPHLTVLDHCCPLALCPPLHLTP